MQGLTKLNPLSRWFLILIAGAVFLTFGWILKPFFLTIITAVVFAILFSRLDRWLALKVHSRHLSAALIAFGVFLVILVPIAVIAVIIAQQANDVLKSGFLENIPQIFQSIQGRLSEIFPTFLMDWVNSIDFAALPTTIVTWLKDNLTNILAGGANFVLQMFIFFAFLYYFLLNKDVIRREIFELSPFKDKLDQGIISRISATIRGVIVGAIIIAFIQAALAAIGLTIFGVPKGILWGSFALIAAQVPMVGVSLIMLPAILYLLATGSTGAAIGLTIWSATVVGLVDNFLSPILVGRRTKMPELFVLVSVLGGLQVFGPIGFVLGPVVLACVLVLRDLYRSGNLV